MLVAPQLCGSGWPKATPTKAAPTKAAEEEVVECVVASPEPQAFRSVGAGEMVRVNVGGMVLGW